LTLDAPGEADRLAAQIALRHQRVPKTIAARVTELADNGMSPFEVSSITGLPLPMVNLILRGAPPGVTK
jgi:hypothetical protein